MPFELILTSSQTPRTTIFSALDWTRLLGFWVPLTNMLAWRENLPKVIAEVKTIGLLNSSHYLSTNLTIRRLISIDLKILSPKILNQHSLEGSSIRSNKEEFNKVSQGIQNTEDAFEHIFAILPFCSRKSIAFEFWGFGVWISSEE